MQIPMKIRKLIVSERTIEFFKKMQEFLPSTKEEYVESVKEISSRLLFWRFWEMIKQFWKRQSNTWG